MPYILFLASGSICMSAMNAASFEALYSAFSRMHVQKTWDGIMNAPVSLDNVVLAEMLWAGFKAMFTVTAILCVMLALGISHSPKLLVAWPVLARRRHHLLVHRADLQCAGQGLRLLHLLLHAVPHADDVPVGRLLSARAAAGRGARRSSDWLPLTNAVELVRPMFMDQWPAHPCAHALVLVAYTVAAFWVALALTRKRSNPDTLPDRPRTAQQFLLCPQLTELLSRT